MLSGSKQEALSGDVAFVEAKDFVKKMEEMEKRLDELAKQLYAPVRLDASQMAVATGVVKALDASPAVETTKHHTAKTKLSDLKVGDRFVMYENRKFPSTTYFRYDSTDIQHLCYHVECIAYVIARTKDSITFGWHTDNPNCATHHLTKPSIEQDTPQYNQYHNYALPKCNRYYTATHLYENIGKIIPDPTVDITSLSNDTICTNCNNVLGIHYGSDYGSDFTCPDIKDYKHHNAFGANGLFEAPPIKKPVEEAKPKPEGSDMRTPLSEFKVGDQFYIWERKGGYVSMFETDGEIDDKGRIATVLGIRDGLVYFGWHSSQPNLHSKPSSKWNAYFPNHKLDGATLNSLDLHYNAAQGWNTSTSSALRYNKTEQYVEKVEPTKTEAVKDQIQASVRDALKDYVGKPLTSTIADEVKEAADEAIKNFASPKDITINPVATLASAKLGEAVEVYYKPSGWYSRELTDHKTEATIIAIDGNYTVLGWIEKPESDAIPLECFGIDLSLTAERVDLETIKRHKWFRKVPSYICTTAPKTTPVRLSVAAVGDQVEIGIIPSMMVANYPQAHNETATVVGISYGFREFDTKVQLGWKKDDVCSVAYYAARETTPPAFYTSDIDQYPKLKWVDGDLLVNNLSLKKRQAKMNAKIAKETTSQTQDAHSKEYDWLDETIDHKKHIEKMKAEIAAYEKKERERYIDRKMQMTSDEQKSSKELIEEQQKKDEELVKAFQNEPDEERSKPIDTKQLPSWVKVGNVVVPNEKQKEITKYPDCCYGVVDYAGENGIGVDIRLYDKNDVSIGVQVLWMCDKADWETGWTLKSDMPVAEAEDVAQTIEPLKEEPAKDKMSLGSGLLMAGGVLLGGLLSGMNNARNDVRVANDEPIDYTEEATSDNASINALEV